MEISDRISFKAFKLKWHTCLEKRKLSDLNKSDWQSKNGSKKSLRQRNRQLVKRNCA